jgi:hypothetical protein
MDIGTNKEKIRISYPKAFMIEVDHWHKLKTGNNEAKQPKNKVTEQFWDDTETNNDIPNEYITVRDGPEVSKLRAIKDLISNKYNLCMVYWCNMGTGKTETLIDYIKTLDKNVPLLSISFRVTLSEKQKDDFKDLGFTHYQHKDLIKNPVINITETKRLIIQIDSLPKVIGDLKDGILILDEIESIITHIYSSIYIKDRTKIIRRLVAYIRNAKYVWVADANISLTTLKFLSEVCHRDVTVYRNDFVRNEREIYFYDGQYALEEGIVADLLKVKNLYIPTNSNAYAEYLFKQLQEKCPSMTGKLYNKDTQIQTDCDPVVEWKNYNYVITTPKFQAGNSFTDEHFDKVYAYFSGASCSPEASCQLLGRVRNLRDSKISMYIDNRVGGDKHILRDVNTFEEMKKKILEMTSVQSSAHNVILSNKDVAVIDFDIHGQLDIGDPCTFLMIASRFNANQGYKDYTKRMVSLMKSYGYTFGGNLSTNSVEENEKESAKKKDIYSYKVQKEDAINNGIATADNISDEKAKEIITRMRSGNDTVTSEEKQSLRKFRLTADVKLLNPNDGKNIAEARIIKRKKALISQLVETARIDNVTDEFYTLEKCLANIAGLVATDINMSRMERMFYKMEATNKAITVSYIISSVKKLGFFGLFDIREMVINKNDLVEFYKKEQENIEKVFQKPFTELQLTPKKVLTWLNPKLKSMFGITIESISKTLENSKYKIESPWRVVVNHGIPEILHYPLETDVPYDQYLESYLETMKQVIECLPADKIPVTFEDCYIYHNTYSGAVIIPNILAWKRMCKLLTDPVKIQQAQSLALHNEIYKAYEYHLAETDKSGIEAMLWNDFLEREKKKRTLIVETNY